MKVLFVMNEDGSYDVFSDIPNMKVTVIDDSYPNGDVIRDDEWLDRVDDEISKHSWEIEPKVISPEGI